MLITPFIPENAPFDANQRSWLNGYLAGLLAAHPDAGIIGTEQRSLPPAIPLLVLFGSQTGTAEALARRFAREAKARNFSPRVLDAAAHGTVDWKKETQLLIITSTYGDGDMPDNAQSFWEWLNTDAASALAHVNFSVLALGDSSYHEFCAAGKKIDARLEQLGAKRIHARADCDLDYEAAAKSWLDGLFKELCPASSATSVLEAKDSKAHQSLKTSEATYSIHHPFPARLVVNRRLTGEGSGKETRHFEFSLEGSGLSYEAGDALGIYPTNCPKLVEDILRALHCDGEEAVPTPNSGERPLRKALGSSYDITKPALDLLQRCAAGHETLRELLGAERKDDLKKWLWGRGVIDLLLETPDVRFAPADFVGLLKPLGRRLYSISSSPKAHAEQAHLTINIVRYHAHGRARTGVASTFLADRADEGNQVPVFVQTSPGFRLPNDAHTPIIMVGPGTGVAPFRAFLHERRAGGAEGRNWLFFGEQRAGTDFYYREEFDAMQADGLLTRLDTAFSRDQEEKLYVQHRMLERAAELWAWLQEGAHFYVCGDALHMAKDVDLALHKIAETAGGLGKESAMEFVKKLKAEKRYQRDVY